MYRNSAYTPVERAADLVSRMTLAEKASQMVSGQSPAIPRLGIHAYGWWNESLHGVSRLQLAPTGAPTALVNTTVYPSDLALGSTWDPGLVYGEASAISDEARDVVPGHVFNLDFFAPTVNLARDPRWGRNDETYSEDPLLTAGLAAQYVNGLEGRSQSGRLLAAGGGYLKAIATLKHYAANNTEATRFSGSSNVDARTLREYYTAQFRLINQQTNPGAMMTALNAINGTPASANTLLTQTLARQTFGFAGYFTSDCDSIQGITLYQRWRPRGYRRFLNPTEAHAFANAAGLDLNCTSTDDPLTAQNLLPAAVGEGIRTTVDTYNEQDVNGSLVRLFTARMQLGEFGNIGREPWVRAARARLTAGSWVNSDANHAVTETPARLGLARGVADRAIVLLKNAVTQRKNDSTGKLLPLTVPRSGPFSVAVIGTMANQPNMYLGGYSSLQGVFGQAHEVTPFQGIRTAVRALNPGATVTFIPGFTSGRTAAELTSIDPTAITAAANYDAVIVYVGTDRSTAGEYNDRTGLALPGAQAQLINSVAAVNPNTVAVMDTVGEVDVSSFAGRVPAMLWSSYNGQLGGAALADVLLGNYDPSGHLPFTWYQSEQQLAPITDYGIRPSRSSLGRTYMYFRGAVSYPFGYGLSYTAFRSSNLRLSAPSVSASGTVQVSLDVTNTGPVWGQHLMQLYVTPPGAGNGQQPIKRLEGFRQVGLAPGQTQAVTLPLQISELGTFDPSRGRFVVRGGRYGIQLAASAADRDIELGTYLRVTGRLQPVPAVLTAAPILAGDRLRGIRSRVIFPLGTTVQPNVTVAMNDQSLYGYGHAPLPRGAVIRLRSDRPQVAAVARDGSLLTVGDGVATVTATVRLSGHSTSGRFVVRVVSQLSGLAVNGQTLPSFHPDTYGYDVLVPPGARTPRLIASGPTARTWVRVRQAAAVPGAATATVTGPDGLAFTYKVRFARPALGDAFSGARPGAGWSWIRPDPLHRRLVPGSLTLAAGPGDLSTHSARNLLVEPALGDWTLQSRLQFSPAPHAPTQQGGLIAYQDDDNYLKVDLEFSNGAVRLSEITADRLSGAPVTQVLSAPLAPQLQHGLWLRMVKRGPRYATYYSGDGLQFAELYNTGASLSNVKLGLFALGGSDPTTDPAVTFTALRVSNSGTTAATPPKKPVAGRKGKPPRTHKGIRLGALDQHRRVRGTRT
ncbi:MAG: glycoside hydrolase family 3 C-terminal domain-containing protein [Solirubrobacteraceae bacterium]